MNQKPHVCINFSRAEEWDNYLSRNEQRIMLSAILTLTDGISKIMDLKTDHALAVNVCPSAGKGNDGPFFEIQTIVLASTFIHKGWPGETREWRIPIGMSVISPNRCWTGQLEHSLHNITNLVCKGLAGTIPIKTILHSCGIHG